MAPCIILREHELPPGYLYMIVQELKGMMQVITLRSEACIQNSSEMQIYC